MLKKTQQSAILNSISARLCNHSVVTSSPYCRDPHAAPGNECYLLPSPQQATAGRHRFLVSPLSFDFASL